jgi:hypothetical protein
VWTGVTTPVINRIQALVLAFFVFVWVALIVILIAAPGVYDTTLRLTGSKRLLGEASFLIVLTVFLAVLMMSVVQRRRWAFWLILVAFLAGALRVPASILEVSGAIQRMGPLWYSLLQGIIGVVQFAIGVVMLRGYRRAGVWGGAVNPPPSASAARARHAVRGRSGRLR